MSYLKFLADVNLFRSLYEFDLAVAKKVQSKGCGHNGCGGPLHCAGYRRSPRGSLVEIPDPFNYRQSFCCGWCRKRTLPPSSLFFGRRVYFGCAVFLIVAELESISIASLIRKIGQSLCRRTLRRWQIYFREKFRQTSLWRSRQGYYSDPLGELPSCQSLINQFFSTDRPKLSSVVSCFRFIGMGALPAGP